MPRTPRRHPDGHLRRWGAVYLMGALFLASLVAQYVMMLIEAGDEARAHGQTFELHQFIPQFLAVTFENWQSEWLQLIFQAVVLLGFKHVWFRADAEDTEEILADLRAIKDHLGLGDQLRPSSASVAPTPGTP